MKTASMDWALWFYWIMATTLGWLSGKLLAAGIPVVVSGVAIAALQSVVLYRRFPRAWRWLLASSAGWIAGYMCAVVLAGGDPGLLAGPLVGAAAGIPQWLVLRERFHWTGWWLVISPLAWTTGLTLVPGALTSGALPGALSGLALVIFFRYAARVPGEKGGAG